MRYKALPEVAAKYALGLGLNEQSPLSDWENGLKTVLEAKKRALHAVRSPSLLHKAERECAEIQEALRLVAQLNLFGKLRRCLQDDKQETFEWELKKPEGLAALPKEDDPLYGDYLDLKSEARKKWSAVSFPALTPAPAPAVPPAAPVSPVIPAPPPATLVPPVATPPPEAPISPELKSPLPAGSDLAAPPPPLEQKPQAPVVESKAPQPPAPPKDATLAAIPVTAPSSPPAVRPEPAAAVPPSAAREPKTPMPPPSPETSPRVSLPPSQWERAGERGPPLPGSSGAQIASKDRSVLSPQTDPQGSSPPPPAQSASADQAFQQFLIRVGRARNKVLFGALGALLLAAAAGLVSRYHHRHPTQSASLPSLTPATPAPATLAPQPTSRPPEPKPTPVAPSPAPNPPAPLRPTPPVEEKPVVILPKPALLVVDSSPPGGVVSLDGRRQPISTPAKFTLSPGAYNVGIVVEGYFATNTTVTLSPDQQITLTFLDPAKRTAGSVAPAASTVALIPHPPKEVKPPAPSPTPPPVAVTPPPAREPPTIVVTPPPALAPETTRSDPAKATALAMVKVGNQYVHDQAKDKVIEIRARKERGNIPPPEWDILYDDQKEFGLTRTATEVHIRNGQYEGAGQQGISGPAGIGVRKPMPLERLKIDSDRALQIARTSLGSDVPLIQGDFSLHSGPADLPVWTIKLWTSKSRDPRALVDLGFIEISAEDGSILKNALRPDRRR